MLGSGWIDTFVDGGSAVVGVGRGGYGPVQALDGVRWSQAASFPANPHDNAGPIAAATFWQDRFVVAASGQDFRPSKSTSNGVVWTSADGSTWQLATEITDAYNVTSLAGNRDRLVAVGYMCESISGPCNARAWTTTDLVTWSRAEVESPGGWMITHVVEFDGRFVMLGERGPGEHGAIGAWSSRDGVRWERREELPGVNDRSAVLSLIRSPSGLVAVGLRGGRAAVWLSTDGNRWMSVPDQPSFDAGIMTSVTSSSAGIVAVGGSCDPCETGITYPIVEPAIWRSTDGLTWTVEHPLFVDGAANPQTMDALLVRDDTWILATHDSWQNRGEETPMSIWLSPPA